MKEGERIIREVILAVKTWRVLKESRICNLTKGAEVVGISKKSLDDYYLVLRAGDQLGFDYASNLDKKMGELRAFIKNNEEKVSGKLGSELRCGRFVGVVNPKQVINEWYHRQNFEA